MRKCERSMNASVAELACGVRGHFFYDHREIGFSGR